MLDEDDEVETDELLLELLELLLEEVLTLDVLDEELLEELELDEVETELVELDDDDEELELDDELVVVSVISVSDDLNAYSDIRLIQISQPWLNRSDRQGTPGGAGHTGVQLLVHRRLSRRLSIRR